MSDITYYVALSLTEDDTGTLVPGAGEEFQGPTAAIRRAETLARMPGIVGSVAFSRTGDPMAGEFKEATILRAFGQVPSDLAGF